MKGLYIHIPFCLSRCTYCSFTSTTKSKTHQDRYIDALVKEMYIYKDQKIDSIYIGGGTPSILSFRNIEKLIDKINENFELELKEFTFECNPEDINEDLLKILKSRGVNRISMGVQTFNEKILKILNRRHSNDSALNAIKLTKKYFDNYSIDLILGLPYQSLDSFKNDLKLVHKINPAHISIYGLKVEEGTRLKRDLDENKYEVPTEDEQAKFYDFAIKYLSMMNIERYEVSNFAKKGFESYHNLKYWIMQDYIGLGVSAHSLIGNKRFFNIDDIDKYIDMLERNSFNNEIEEMLSNDDKIYETIMLELRLRDGLNYKKLNKDYEIDFLNRYKNVIDKYKMCFEINETNIRIRDEFLYSMNQILSEF